MCFAGAFQHHLRTLCEKERKREGLNEDTAKMRPVSHATPSTKALKLLPKNVIIAQCVNSVTFAKHVTP